MEQAWPSNAPCRAIASGDAVSIRIRASSRTQAHSSGDFTSAILGLIQVSQPFGNLSTTVELQFVVGSPTGTVWSA